MSEEMNQRRCGCAHKKPRRDTPGRIKNKCGVGSALRGRNREVELAQDGIDFLGLLGKR
jgi:hypothetical protein